MLNGLPPVLGVLTAVPPPCPVRLSADGPTFATPSSYADAMRAACAAVALVDAVVASSSRGGSSSEGGAGQQAPPAGAASGFSICRPPGHHATPGDQMGFCLLNNVALAARHAQRAHGLQKVRPAAGRRRSCWQPPQVPFPMLGWLHTCLHHGCGSRANEPTTQRAPHFHRVACRCCSWTGMFTMAMAPRTASIATPQCCSSTCTRRGCGPAAAACRKPGKVGWGGLGC
jgi:hypothetical protein